VRRWHDAGLLAQWLSAFDRRHWLDGRCGWFGLNHGRGQARGRAWGKQALYSSQHLHQIERALLDRPACAAILTANQQHMRARFGRNGLAQHGIVIGIDDCQISLLRIIDQHITGRPARSQAEKRLKGDFLKTGKTHQKNAVWLTHALPPNSAMPRKQPSVLFCPALLENMKLIICLQRNVDKLVSIDCIDMKVS
jgi:hypothetical protein